MSNVVKEDIDQLNAKVTVTVKKDEYEPIFNQELKKYRQQSNLKGFRKGKAPMSALKKMYGKSVLVDVVNKKLQEQLYNFLEEENIKYLGQPLISDEQETIDFDLKNMRDYEFKFDIGLMPEVEIQGLDNKEFERYDVTIPDEVVEDQLESAQRQAGERTEPEEDIQDDDVVTFAVKELEGDAPKEDGLEAEFSVLVNTIAEEAVKEELLTKKKGDTIRFNIFKLENQEADKVRRYYLNLEEDDDREVNEEFEGEITKVSRAQPAELNQEFFDQQFGEGKVTSKEEALEELRKNLKDFYDKEADFLLSHELREHLIESNSFELPDEFLKRWLKSANEELTDEVLEREYANFQKNTVWTLIRRKVRQDNDIDVSQEEIIGKVKEQILGMYGGAFAANPELLNSIAQRALQDQEQVERIYEQILTEKVLDVLKEEITIKDKPVDNKEMDDILTAFQDKMQQEDQARAAAQQEEEE